MKSRKEKSTISCVLIDYKYYMWHNINMTKKKTTTKKRTTKKSVKKATPYAAVKRKTGGAVLKSAKITIGEKTEIVGRIEKLVWTNEDHSWSVIKFKPKKGAIFTAKGSLIEITPGMPLKLYGTWIETDFGEQFDVDMSEITYTDATREAVVNILSSSFLTGSGETKANLIYDKFGKDTFTIIEFNPERLTEVYGIGEYTAATLHDSYMKNKCKMELAALLKPDASDNLINKIIEKYGEDNAVKTIKKDPYILCRGLKGIDGIAFGGADRIAVRKIGIALNSPVRIDAAIEAGIMNAGREGHCYLPYEEVYSHVRTALQEAQGGTVTEEEVKDRLRVSLKEQRILIEKSGKKFLVYTKGMHDLECDIADKVSQLILTKSSIPQVSDKDIDTGIKETEKQNKFALEKNQKEAVRSALKNRVCIITGGPGTGKSTILDAILKAWCKNHSKEDVLLCAPTGRAATRMREVTGFPANTIHMSVMNRPGTSGMNKLVVCDEVSMVDVNVCSMLLSLVSHGGQLVLIGDPDQLPSVGAGNVLHDLINCQQIPVTKLTIGHRNVGAIAYNANELNHCHGVDDFQLDDTFKYIESDSEDLQAHVLEEYYKIVDKYGIKDTCCICPMKSRGSTSTKKLNDIIREKLNPIPADKANIPSVKDSEFRLNDRVMLTKNTRNAEGATRMLVNGDLGFITDIRWVQRKVTVTFDDGERGIFEFSEFCRKFELAYASTIHKCQGQEYKAVVIPCSGEHYIMLQKNLLYTAVTRAKKECILIGGKKYIKMAAENEAAAQRYTMLAWRINHNVLAAHI